MTTTSIKKKYTSDFKAKVALELLKGEETVSQICSKYSIHPTEAFKWKNQALVILKSGFDEKTDTEKVRQLKEKEQQMENLYQQIGQQKVELDWLKKKFSVIA